MEEFYLTHQSALNEMVSPDSDCLLANEGPKCKALMKSLDIMGVSFLAFKDRVIGIESHGFTTHNKGLAYSKAKIAPLYSNLDRRPADLEAYSKGFKKIDENWYIYYEYLN